MAVLQVTAKNFENEVLASEKTVLADFYADWCGPCRALKGTVEEISRERAATLKTVKINIDDEEELAETYGIYSIPCLIVFKDGKEVARSVGLRPKEEILAVVDGVR